MGLLLPCLQGSVMALVVIALRAALRKRLPALTFYALWLFVIARFLMPFQLHAPLSIWPSAPLATEAAVAPEHMAQAVFSGPVAWRGSVDPPIPSSNPAAISESPAAAGAEAGGPSLVPTALVIIWAIGFAACVMFFILSCARLASRCRQARPVTDGQTLRWLAAHRIRRPLALKACPGIGSPLTYGLLRPVILLPEDFDWKGTSASLVLEHEYVHVRRFDALFKLAAALMACMYWFNPLTWVVLHFFNRDVEVSCDEWVIRGQGRQSVRAYALALIDSATIKCSLVSSFSGWASSALKERIMSLSKKTNYKTTTLASSALAAMALLVPLATTGLATGSEGTDASAIVQSASEDAPSISETTNGTLGAQSALITYNQSLGADLMMASSCDVTMEDEHPGTYLTTPSYAQFVPQGLLSGNMAWGYATRADAAPVTLPTGATDVLSVADATTGDIRFTVFCLPRESMDADEPELAGFGIYSLGMAGDGTRAAWLALADGVSPELADWFWPVGSTSQVRGIGQPMGGPQSPEAYSASAEPVDGGHLVKTPSYSLVLPSGIADHVTYASFESESPVAVDTLSLYLSGGTVIMLSCVLPTDASPAESSPSNVAVTAAPVSLASGRIVQVTVNDPTSSNDAATLADELSAAVQAV